MRRKYKIIRAPSLDLLQTRVDAFLDDDVSDGFEALGAPQVFGHEEYVQAFVNNYEVL